MSPSTRLTTTPARKRCAQRGRPRAAPTSPGSKVADTGTDLTVRPARFSFRYTIPCAGRPAVSRCSGAPSQLPATVAKVLATTCAMSRQIVLEPPGCRSRGEHRASSRTTTPVASAADPVHAGSCNCLPSRAPAVFPQRGAGIVGLPSHGTTGKRRSRRRNPASAKADRPWDFAHGPDGERAYAVPTTITGCPVGRQRRLRHSGCRRHPATPRPGRRHQCTASPAGGGGCPVVRRTKGRQRRTQDQG